MLVLSRTFNERVFLEVPGRLAPIVVTVTNIQPGKVRLGIEADDDITVLREEVAVRRAAQPTEYDHV